MAKRIKNWDNEWEDNVDELFQNQKGKKIKRQYGNKDIGKMKNEEDK